MKRERFLLWLGRKLVPEKVRYWIIIDAFAEATFRHVDLEPDLIGFSKLMGGGSRRLEDCSLPVLDVRNSVDNKMRRKNDRKDRA